MTSRETASEAAKLPAHVRETLDAIADLHSEHRRSANFWERCFDRSAAVLATPAFLIGFTLFSFGWIVVNGILPRDAFDHAPFALLDTILALLAVYISLAIVAAQRRAASLADLRAQLTLQHSILAENKAAKIIQLLEELRKDDPMIADRPDSTAEALAAPTDPSAVAAAISETNKGE